MKALVFSAVLLIIASVSSETPRDDDPVRVDCHTEQGATQGNCEARGCKWQPTPEQPNVHNRPYCFFDSDISNYAGYDVVSTNQPDPSSMQLKLKRRSTKSIYGGEVTYINVDINMMFDDHVRILISDDDASRTSRYYAPNDHHNNKWNRVKREIKDSNNRLYDIIVEKSPFGIAVKRRSTGTFVFDTRGIPGFQYSDQFLQITTRLPSTNLYGIGEHMRETISYDFSIYNRWGMFAADSAATNGNHGNLYGVHPFYLNVENDGNVNGLILMNTHAMSADIQSDPALTWRMNGGVLDFTIFLGPDPVQIVETYVQQIGLPFMPPYWALGFQLCRYGYQDINDVKSTYERNKNAGIPQEVQYVDIDYMDDWRDFTVDPDKFGSLGQFADQLHADNRKLILILDPCIASRGGSSYQALQDGLNMNAFIKLPNGSLIEGCVWAGPCYFPDFTSPNGQAYWAKQIADFHKKVAVDGLWIDMNEPSNFQGFNGCPGSEGSTKGCPNDVYSRPAYCPVGDCQGHTMCLNGVQAWGVHYNIHNLYGHSEAIASNYALRQLFPGKRPMVVGRSTFVGSGHFEAHWLGDNSASWEDMADSIIGTIEFNMFGIPFVGPDVCGFNGEPSENLCRRWLQLGAFYPFSRNHNTHGTQPQDPAHWSQATIDSTKKALGIRYKLLPYLYTLMHKANQKGTPVIWPLYYLDPADSKTWSVGDQMMWSNGLMIVPIIKNGMTSRTAYFPKSRWYDYYSGGEIDSSPSSGRSKTLNIADDSIGLYVRGGTVIPWQGNSQTLTDSRKNPMGILAALDDKNTAFGSFFWDDGESLDTHENGDFLAMHFNVSFSQSSGGRMMINRMHNGYRGSDGLQFNTVQIFGVPNRPSSVKINGGSASFNYDAGNKVLTINNAKIPVSSGSNDLQTIVWS